MIIYHLREHRKQQMFIKFVTIGMFQMMWLTFFVVATWRNRMSICFWWERSSFNHFAQCEVEKNFHSSSTPCDVFLQSDFYRQINFDIIINCRQISIRSEIYWNFRWIRVFICGGVSSLDVVPNFKFCYFRFVVFVGKVQKVWKTWR